MDLTLELIANIFAERFSDLLYKEKLNIPTLAQNIALRALADIQQVIMDESLSDFDAIEEIVCLFEKYNLNAGFRHDFG